MNSHLALTGLFAVLVATECTDDRSIDTGHRRGNSGGSQGIRRPGRTGQK